MLLPEIIKIRTFPGCGGLTRHNILMLPVKANNNIQNTDRFSVQPYAHEKGPDVTPGLFRENIGEEK